MLENKSSLSLKGVSSRKVQACRSLSDCLVFLFLERTVPALSGAPGLPGRAEEGRTFQEAGTR